MMREVGLLGTESRPGNVWDLVLDLSGISSLHPSSVMELGLSVSSDLERTE